MFCLCKVKEHGVANVCFWSTQQAKLPQVKVKQKVKSAREKRKAAPHELGDRKNTPVTQELPLIVQSFTSEIAHIS